MLRQHIYNIYIYISPNCSLYVKYVQSGVTAMMKAARGGFLNIVRRLKEAGADCHTRSNVIIEFVFSVKCRDIVC